MAFLRSKSARSLSLLLVAFLIIFFITTFLVVRVYIPSTIKEMIIRFSKENDIALSIDRVAYSPFSGFRGEEIKLGDMPDQGLSGLEIKKVIVSPQIIRSYLSGKLVLGKIMIDGADLRLNEEIFEIASARKDKDTPGDKDEDELPVEVREVGIKNLRVNIEGKHPVNIDDVELTLDKNGDIYNIGVHARLGEKAAIEGDLEINDKDKSGILNADVQNIEKGIYLGYLSIPQDLHSKFNADFNYGNGINIKGRVFVSGSDNTDDPEIANLSFITVYSEQDNKFNIQTMDLRTVFASLSAAGDIGIGITEPGYVAAVEGKFDITDIGELARWITPLDKSRVEGSLHSDSFILTNSAGSNELKLSAKIESDQISVRDIKFGNIESDADLILGPDRTDLNLSNISADIFGGSLSGKLNYSGQEKQRVTAIIRAKDLAFEQMGKQFNLPLSGRAENTQADLTVQDGNIYSEIMLTTENLQYGEGVNILTLSKTFSSGPLTLKIGNFKEGINIEIQGDNIDLKGFDYFGLSSASSTLKDIKFIYINDKSWEMSLNAKGNEITYASSDAVISDYNIELKLKEDETVIVSGKLTGKTATFKSTSFSNISTGFDYRSASLRLYDSMVSYPEYGSVNLTNTEILLPSDNDSNYEIVISGGKASILNRSIQLKGIRGEMLYQGGPSTNIKGHLYADNISGYRYKLPGATAGFNYRNGIFNLERFNTKIFDGSFNASGSLDTGKPARDFSLDLELKKASGVMGIESVDLGEISLKVSGKIKKVDHITGSGKLRFADLKIKSNNRESRISGSTDISLIRETILFENAFIKDDNGKRIEVSGEIHNLFNENRGSTFTIPDTSLAVISKMVSPLLPGDISNGNFIGNISASIRTYNLFEKLSNWQGRLELQDAGFTGSISRTDFQMTGIEGVITLREKTKFKNRLEELMGKDLLVTKKIYRQYVQHFRETDVSNNGDYLRIDMLKYGFLTMYNINSIFEIDKTKVNLLHLRSDLYGGKIYSTGVLRFGGENENYNLSLLIDDISLKQITDSLPSMQNYISGIVYGILWFSVEDSYWSVNGPFSIWAKDSDEEKRTLGRALLEKLGAKSRFFTRSSRRYDKGIISGYIKDGIMTFKNFEISNRILGYQDLLIQADEKMNSISIKHLLSVIRELARRASKGGIQIDYENKKN